MCVLWCAYGCSSSLFEAGLLFALIACYTRLPGSGGAGGSPVSASHIAIGVPGLDATSAGFTWDLRI